MALRQRLRHSRLSPWAAAIAGAFAWALHQQVLGDLLHFDCRRGGAWTGLAIGVACLLLIASGVAITVASRHANGWGGDTRRFVASVSLMAAGLFVLPVLLQTLAGFVLPGCAR
jgi:hypothetical protein